MARGNSRSHHADDHLYDQEARQNEDVAHEDSDVNIRAIVGFAVGLGVIAVVIHVAMWGLFIVFENQAAENDPVVSPLAQPAGQLPPEPRLLTDEPQNLHRFRTGLRERLKGIEAGKQQLLRDGLPVRANAPADPWLGTDVHAGGESSSGRAIPHWTPRGPESPPAVLVPGQPPPPTKRGGG